MPPLQTSGIEYTSQKRYHKADVRGGVKTPPYKPGYTVGLPANPAWGIPLPGGMYASPTAHPETAGEWASQASAVARVECAKTRQKLHICPM